FAPAARPILLLTIPAAIAAGITAYLSTKFLMRYFQHHRLAPFGWYCIVFGAYALYVLRFSSIVPPAGVYCSPVEERASSAHLQPNPPANTRCLQAKTSFSGGGADRPDHSDLFPLLQMRLHLGRRRLHH